MKTALTNSTNFQKAKKRLDQLKSFYTHLTAYFRVNTMLFIVYFYSKNSIF